MNDNVLWLNKLVPKHVLLDDAEVETKLGPLNVIPEQLPKILLKDPALKALDQEAKPGDVVEVEVEGVGILSNEVIDEVINETDN